VLGNSKLLYGSFAVFGIAFLTVFFPNPIFFPAPNLFFMLVSWLISSTMWLIISCFFSTVGVVFLTAGICGVGSRYFKNVQPPSGLQPSHEEEPRARHVRLHGGITALGIVFLGVFFTIFHLGGHWAEVTGFFMRMPLAGLLMFIVFLFGGTGFLTAGTCGIARQYFKNNQILFTMVAAISIPSLIIIPILYWWLIGITVVF